MRALVQRVTGAWVDIEGQRVSEIGPGMLVLLGIATGDGPEQADWIARKLAALRIFEDCSGRMNRAVADAGGQILCVSQFTLMGDARRGNRPSFTDAAGPEVAEPLYDRVCDVLGARRGRFGAEMQVGLVNDGPVTLLIET